MLIATQRMELVLVGKVLLDEIVLAFAQFGHLATIARKIASARMEHHVTLLLENAIVPQLWALLEQHVLKVTLK